MNHKLKSIVAFCMLLQACGSGNEEVNNLNNPDQTGDSPASSAGLSPSSGSNDADNGGLTEPMRADAPREPECESGETRTAEPGEEGSRCQCNDERLWVCYGVAPERQIGGDADCKSRHRVGREERCEITYSDCSDNRTYSVRCHRVDACICMVNASVVGEIEPGVPCIDTLQEANELCDWSLTHPLE